jgi:hypothetical protein
MMRVATQWAGWAEELEPLRRGPRGFGLFGSAALCCIVVVGGIVLVVVLLTRRR